MSQDCKCRRCSGFETGYFELPGDKGTCEHCDSPVVVTRFERRCSCYFCYGCGKREGEPCQCWPDYCNFCHTDEGDGCTCDEMPARLVTRPESRTPRMTPTASTMTPRDPT